MQHTKLSRLALLSLACLAVVFGSGCRRHGDKQSNTTADNSAGNNASFDVCSLLTSREIEELQGSPIKESKPSTVPGALQTWQCFYVAEEFSKSVNLSITRGGQGSDKTAITNFWKQKFVNADKREEEERETEREGDREKRESLREQREEREHEGAPMQKIEGLGDDAYWSGTRVGGALYVLKNQAFLRISLGGADTNEARIEKARKLAAKALERL